MVTKMPLERVQGRADVPKYTCFFHPDYNRRLGFTPIMPCGSQTIGDNARILPVETFTPP